MNAPLMHMALRLLTRILREQDGQGLTEYAMLLVFVAVAAILALAFLGGNVNAGLSSVARTV
jgi:Flp pilus assembly pilin Flp